MEYPSGEYKTVVIDPPWPVNIGKYKVGIEKNKKKYDSMSVNDIISLPIHDMLSVDSFVYLWVTQRFLPDAFKCIDAWCDRYRFTMVWHKPHGFQPIGLPQYNAEFVVVGSIGKPKFISTKKFPTIFNAPRRGHSVKPEEFYELLRRVTDEPRLDMFSRRKIEGFDVWGDEVGFIKDGE